MAWHAHPGPRQNLQINQLHMDIPLLEPESYELDQPTHAGQCYAGQTLTWLMSDSQSSYDRLIQDASHQEYFSQQGWDQPAAITYQINSQGFRGPEFCDTIGLMTLGCSFTMGIGLPQHTVWPYQVADHMQLPVANLAWPGLATDTCVRLASYWLPRLQPRLVIMLMPPIDRFEIHIDPDYAQETGNIFPVEVLMPQVEISAFRRDTFVKHYWLNARNSEINRWKNQLALKHMCHTHGIPCMIYCCMHAFARSREEVGYARDHMHAGPRGHDLLAEKIMKDWNEIKHA